MFTGKAWDGVSTKGREPVFRIKSIIEKALFGGKENRAFLVEFACCGRELLRDREAFGLCGKRFFVALCCLGKIPGGAPFSQLHKGGFFFLLYAAWVRSRAERPSVSYTKVVSKVARTGHNLQFTKMN